MINRFYNINGVELDLSSIFAIDTIMDTDYLQSFYIKVNGVDIRIANINSNIFIKNVNTMREIGLSVPLHIEGRVHEEFDKFATIVESQIAELVTAWKEYRNGN